jgi:hypothetical protein
MTHEGLMTLAASSDGLLLATGSYEKSIKIWDLAGLK